MLLIGVHALRTFISASYKKPRELNWISGVMLFFWCWRWPSPGAMLPMGSGRVLEPPRW